MRNRRCKSSSWNIRHPCWLVVPYQSKGPLIDYLAALQRRPQHQPLSLPRLLCTVSAHQRDTSHRNAPPLCRAVTVRLQLIKKMPSPFTDMPEMPINRWLAGKHGACGRSTLLPLRLHSMGCQRDSCSCQWDSWGQQRDSLSQYWDSCSGEKTVSILAKTVSVSQKSLTVFPWDSPSRH